MVRSSARSYKGVYHSSLNPAIKGVLSYKKPLQLKLKLQYFGHLMQRTESLEKTLMLGKIEGRRRSWDGWMASLTQWIEFEQALGIGDGQESLVCCNPWGGKVSDTTEQLNWADWYTDIYFCLFLQPEFLSTYPTYSEPTNSIQLTTWSMSYLKHYPFGSHNIPSKFQI